MTSLACFYSVHLVCAGVVHVTVQCTRGFACDEKLRQKRPYQLVLPVDTLAVPRLGEQVTDVGLLQTFKK